MCMTFEDRLFKMLETVASRESDPVDAITMDVPLLIRIMELSREDIKTDQQLHDVVERIVSLKNAGTLTMDHYDQIAGVGTEPPQMKSNELESIRRLAGI